MTLKAARLLVAILAAAALPAMAQNLAIVNGKKIPSSRSDALVKQMTAQGQPDSPELRAMIKEQLVNREILTQEADRLGLSGKADVKGQIEMARQQVLIRALVIDYITKNPVQDAEIKAEYDKFKTEAAKAGDKEYHARHILVDKEEEAKALIAKLKGGAKFEELAKQSKDPGSAANGGDLDWVYPGSLEKPFADGMVALQKGQITDTPVKTRYGYHVIKLEDIRTAKIPTLEEVKPQIMEGLQQQKLQAYQESLKKKAKIQ